MKVFHCSNCSHDVYFENVQCEHCGCALGFVPEQMAMRAFNVEAGRWTAAGPDARGHYRPCSNYTLHNVCNWMVNDDVEGQHLCQSCRLTETIPLLEPADNLRYWYLLEKAKRHLLYTLLDLGLPVPDRIEDSERGLGFRLLARVDGEQPPVTGHDSGVITIDLCEADDVHRAAVRKSLGEPYRTLLGHFRHEVAHYYWFYLIEGNSAREEQFRARFGDERGDYAERMQNYYRDGAPVDWNLHFISAYAASHPWEDWAETFAHYLHIKDALDTAQHYGVVLQRHRLAVDSAMSVDRAFRRALQENWLPLAAFLNLMNRSLGQEDIYPFVISPTVSDKMEYIDEFVKAVASDESKRFAPKHAYA